MPTKNNVVCLIYLITKLGAQVFTSVSTLIFRTFACDNNAMSGRSFLTADYSISCDSNTHTVFEVYAGLMILVRYDTEVTT